MKGESGKKTQGQNKKRHKVKKMGEGVRARGWKHRILSGKMDEATYAGIECGDKGRRIIGRRITSACNTKKKRPRVGSGVGELLKDRLFLFSQKYAC